MSTVKHAKKLTKLKGRINRVLKGFERTEQDLIDHQVHLTEVMSDIENDIKNLQELHDITNAQHVQASKVANNIGKLLRGDL